MEQNKDINLLTEDFKANLVQLINSAELPPVLIYYIVKAVYEDTAKSYENIINQALLKQQQETTEIKED